MLKFEEEQIYSFNSDRKTSKVMCVGVGSKFSFFSPVKVVNSEIEVDMTKIWAIANDTPDETVVTKLILPIRDLEDGKEN